MCTETHLVHLFLYSVDHIKNLFLPLYARCTRACLQPQLDRPDEGRDLVSNIFQRDLEVAVCDYTNTVSSESWDAAQVKERSRILNGGFAVVPVYCIADAGNVQSWSCDVTPISLSE